MQRFAGNASPHHPAPDTQTLVQYEHITTDQQLSDFCAALSGTSSIGFDTEFVSEDTYRPQLCLLQVAADDRLAVIDPLSIDDVSPFWRLLTDGVDETIVHAGREEFRFCWRATGKRPAGWFDIQLAAGMVGLEYPAAYRTLVSRVLDQSVAKGETRTDWRRRPLSNHQLNYAIADVEHLSGIYETLTARLTDLGRMEWLEEELDVWQSDIEHAESGERWRRVSGISGLNPRMLAIVRRLWQWRESEAKRLNKPVKRVLRDDLIVEMARRKSGDLSRIQQIRGMQNRNLRSQLPTLAKCIGEAIDLPDADLPKSPRRPTRPQLNVLNQFVTTAVNSVCVSAGIAPGITGTSQDVRDLISYHLFPAERDGDVPVLATGWRAEIVGETVNDILAGRLSIKVGDPTSDHPLVLHSESADGSKRK